MNTQTWIIITFQSCTIRGSNDSFEHTQTASFEHAHHKQSTNGYENISTFELVAYRMNADPSMALDAASSIPTNWIGQRALRTRATRRATKMKLFLTRLARLLPMIVGWRLVGYAFVWQENAAVLGFQTLTTQSRNEIKRMGVWNSQTSHAELEETSLVLKRRTFIGSMLSVPVLLPISFQSPRSIIQPVAIAAETDQVNNKKPFAPLENLLPAVRVKRSIDSAINLTRSLVVGGSSNEADPSTTATALRQLESLLLQPPNYVQSGLSLQGVPSKPADLYLKDYRSIKGDLPFQKALVQSGDVDAWKRLKRREKKLEKEDVIRQALNAYTDALSFSGNSYLLTVDPKTKSNMVREDKLPDIKQVITSDMGMRYLYRNQVLTAMDEVRAELEYQLTQSAFDGTELLNLLGQANEAMDRWLSLIPADDVQQALKAIASDGSAQ